MLKPELVNVLVKLKEEGADNTEGARTLAAKALVNLAQLPGSKDAKFFPPLTPQDYELAKQTVSYAISL